MNFYRFHLGDYYKKTSHLSMLEDAAYRRLIDAVYLREGPLPENREQIYRLVRAFTGDERAAVDSVLAEFFVLTDAGYTNARCDEELDAIKERSEKARKSALAGVQARQSLSERSPDAQRTLSERSASHKPVAISHSSSTRDEAPITGAHRVMALDLLDRGKTNLSTWERQFLENLCSRSSLTAKMQSTLDGIAAKLGVSAEEVMATWRKRLGVARQMRQWDAKWGPPPKQLGCLVPDQLLEPGDGDGWAEWRVAS